MRYREPFIVFPRKYASGLTVFLLPDVRRHRQADKSAINRSDDADGSAAMVYGPLEGRDTDSREALADSRRVFASLVRLRQVL